VSSKHFQKHFEITSGMVVFLGAIVLAYLLWAVVGFAVSGVIKENALLLARSWMLAKVSVILACVIYLTVSMRRQHFEKLDRRK
jgi:nitrogen fixation-related uncharacterized protein